MTLLPVLKRKGIPLIGLTGATESPLAHECRYVLDVGVKGSLSAGAGTHFQAQQLLW